MTNYSEKQFNDFKAFLDSPKEVQDSIIADKLITFNSELSFWLQMADSNEFSKIEVTFKNTKLRVSFNFPKKYQVFEKEGKCDSL